MCDIAEVVSLLPAAYNSGDGQTLIILTARIVMRAKQRIKSRLTYLWTGS
jgi:hypothetical protein